MRAESRAAELDALRGRLTQTQRAILNAIWEHYRDQNQWIPRRLLEQRFDPPALRADLQQFRGTAVEICLEDDQELYRLTFLGVLLADQGVESEELLVRYLGYVRDRYKADPRIEWVGSQDVEAALGLTPERSRLLRQLIRQSHWWGGGSGFGHQEWTVGVPIDVDDLLSEPDLRSYVRDHSLRYFLPGASLGLPMRLPLSVKAVQAGGPRGAFWFVTDPALQRQLTMDWHEAQDAHQSRGWKGCVLLCGGILENVLRDALGRVGLGPSAASVWRDLSQLADAAANLGVLGKGGIPVGRALRNYRSLLDPAWQIREGIEVTKDDADAALEAVRSCLLQVAAATPAA